MFPTQRVVSNWKLWSAFCVAVLFIAQSLVRFNSDLHHDPAWYIYVARGLLRGGVLYRDFVEVNPPLAIWMIFPVAVIEQYSGVSAVNVLYGAVFGLTFMSLLLISYLLAKLPSLDAQTTGIVIIFVAFGLLFVPGWNFGQREHLMAILFLPWLMLRLLRAEELQVNVTHALAIGAAAGIAICLKPHAVLAPVAVELLLLLRLRRLPLLVAPENIGAGLFVVTYAAAILLFSPEFFSDLLQLGVDAYVPYYGIDFLSTLQRCLPAAVIIASMGLLRHRLNGPLGSLVDFSLAASVGFLISFVIQAKGYAYQLIPAHVMIVVAASVTALTTVTAYNGGAQSMIRSAAAVLVIGATLFIIPRQYYYEFGKGTFMGAIDRYSPPGIGNRTFLVASTNVPAGFPLAIRDNLVWASRFPTLWLVPYVSHRWRAGSRPGDKIVSYAMKSIVDDLERFKPDVLFINVSNSQDYVKDGTFDYISFLKEDARFAGIWRKYTYRETIGVFDVYSVHSDEIEGG